MRSAIRNMSFFRLRRIILDFPPRQLFHIARQRFLKEDALGGFEDQHPCVFILSTGRTGTQTLAALYELASNVFAYHEPTPELTALSKLAYAYQHEESPAISELLRGAFMTARKPLLEHSLICGRGYVETTPQNTFLAPAILDAIPNARFIHVVRDPRFVVKSAMRRKWYDGNSNDADRIVPAPDSEAGKQWAKYSPFQKNLWLWAETNRWSMAFAARVPQQVLQVKAETLFAGDEALLAKLYTFIGAPMLAQWKINRVLGSQLNAQKTGAFPDYTDWSAEMNHDLQMLAGETAALLGYDLGLSKA